MRLGFSGTGLTTQAGFRLSAYVRWTFSCAPRVVQAPVLPPIRNLHAIENEPLGPRSISSVGFSLRPRANTTSFFNGGSKPSRF